MSSNNIVFSNSSYENIDTSNILDNKQITQNNNINIVDYIMSYYIISNPLNKVSKKYYKFPNNGIFRELLNYNLTKRMNGVMQFFTEWKVFENIEKSPEPFLYAYRKKLEYVVNKDNLSIPSKLLLNIFYLVDSNTTYKSLLEEINENADYTKLTDDVITDIYLRQVTNTINNPSNVTNTSNGTNPSNVTNPSNGTNPSNVTNPSNEDNISENRKNYQEYEYKMVLCSILSYILQYELIPSNILLNSSHKYHKYSINCYNYYILSTISKFYKLFENISLSVDDDLLFDVSLLKLDELTITELHLLKRVIELFNNDKTIIDEIDKLLKDSSKLRVDYISYIMSLLNNKDLKHINENNFEYKKKDINAITKLVEDYIKEKQIDTTTEDITIEIKMPDPNNIKKKVKKLSEKNSDDQVSNEQKIESKNVTKTNSKRVEKKKTKKMRHKRRKRQHKPSKKSSNTSNNANNESNS